MQCAAALRTNRTTYTKSRVRDFAGLLETSETSDVLGGRRLETCSMFRVRNIDTKLPAGFDPISQSPVFRTLALIVAKS